MQFEEWWKDNIHWIEQAMETRADLAQRAWNAATQAERDRAANVAEPHKCPSHCYCGPNIAAAIRKG